MPVDIDMTLVFKRQVSHTEFITIINGSSMPKTTKVSPKKPVAKSKTVKRSKATTASSAMRSFKLSRNTPPFMTKHVTQQTLYWLILMVFIVFVQLWILKIQLDVINTLQSVNITL